MSDAEAGRTGSTEGANAPTILGIDTTSEFGGVALRAGGRLVGQRHLHAPDGFSQVLFFEIEQLFAQTAPIGLTEVDCFAVAAGPGSFTGVRVGLAATKGLAEVARKPVAAISNLRALASFGTLGRRITLLDARRGEVYGAVYDQDLECVSPEAVARLEPWLASLASALPESATGAALCEFVTFAGAPFLGALAGTSWAEMPWTEAPRGLAAAVALCAESDYRAGKTIDALVADANYVRRSDAELFWKG